VLNAAGTLDKLSRTGSLLTSGVGTSGTAASYGGTAFDSSGNVWSVTSAANSVLFTSKLAVGTATKTGGGLNAPVAVAVDGAGYIWVANSGGNTVSAFTNAGVAQSNSSGYGSSYVTGEALSAPSAVVIDKTGGVWVTNKSGNTVTHIFGAAAPVVTPLSSATATGTLGTKP
jgi:secreted PhoX family phosphatase